MPRRGKGALSERKAPLQFCESPVHIRHKQSTPVHGCDNPITADVVPVEDVLNDWVYYISILLCTKWFGTVYNITSAFYLVLYFFLNFELMEFCQNFGEIFGKF